MKQQAPLSARKDPKTQKQKSSGKTPGKPESVADKSRTDGEIPGDRGAFERQSKSQGSE